MLTNAPSRLEWISDTARRLTSRGPVAWVLQLPDAVEPASLLGEVLARLWLTAPGPVAETPVGDGPATLFRHTGTSLGGRLESTLLAEALAAVDAAVDAGGDAGADAEGPFAPVAAALARGRSVWLVLGSADRTLADPDVRDRLLALWRHARASALPFHLLVQTRSDAPELRTLAGELDAGRLPPPPSVTLHDLGTLLPEWKPTRVVTARAVLGVDAATWRGVDPRVSLSANLIRILLDPASPTFDLGLRRLARDVSRTERYADIVRAIAGGAGEWGRIVESAVGLESASQLGPYMKTLEAEGVVRSRRSLDAGPRSRRTRYDLVDDLQAFWFRCVLPVRGRLISGENRRRVWSDAIQPGVRAFVESRLPALIGAELVARPVLGVRAREVGGLWGDGYDLPVSGTLANGAAFHGVGFWRERPPEDTLERLRDQMRETRYGFGRQTRLRLLFVRQDPDHDWERRIARTSDARFLTPAALVGRD